VTPPSPATLALVGVLWSLLVIGLLLAHAGAMGRPWRPSPPGAVRRGSSCPDCGHDGRWHDPDIGCLAALSPADTVRKSDWCPCTRPGCLCPVIPPEPPDAR
jgi:hypothetical protein